MPNFSINEKECDSRLPCIDLNKFSSYLIIPTKFVKTHQRMKEYQNKRRSEVHYSTVPYFFTHDLTYSKNPRENLEFLAIIHPSGQVEELPLTSSDLVSGIFYFYVKQRKRRKVILKNLHGGTHEEKNTQSTLSRRVIQQRLTFNDLCGRSATNTTGI